MTNGWPQFRNQCPENIESFWKFRDEIVVFNGVLLKGNRVIIPKNMQAKILVNIHTGHQGIEKCRLRARKTVYWCGINGDIDNMIRKCDVYQHNQTAQPKEEMIPIDATYPWEIVGSDMFHFRGDEYLLVVDYYSSYPIIRMLSSTISCAVVSKLKLIFSEFGIQNFFISDIARQYDSAEFCKFEAEYDFKHETSSPRYPPMQWKILAICRHREEDPTEDLRSERGFSHCSTVASQVILSLFYNMCIQKLIISAHKHCFTSLPLPLYRYLCNGKDGEIFKLLIPQLIFQFMICSFMYALVMFT